MKKTSDRKTNKQYGLIEKKHRLSTSVVLFILFVSALLLFTLWNEYGGGFRRTYSFTELDFSEKQQGLSVGAVRGLPWSDTSAHSKMPSGAQFDFEIRNESGADFEHWTAEIYFDESPYIDSSWNGEFKSDKKRLTVIPQNDSSGDLTTVFANSTRGFGAVLYTTEPRMPKRMVLNGHWHTPFYRQPLFWILEILTLVMLFVMLLQIMTRIRTARYKIQLEKDNEMIRQAMLTMTDFIDAKDTYTRGHSTRVAVYSTALAEKLGMKEEELRNLFYIALMHDCGKVGIPDAVLKKPGKLTDDEFRLIQAHAAMGNHLLSHFTSIPGIQEGAHYHHEKYDGTGYPDGLKGEEIPYVARIICIADAVDAMSTNRCYRDRLSYETLINELRTNKGGQFDPNMVDPMIRLIEDGLIEETQKNYPNRR